MKPLKEQILASHPNKNIWVSANAGTGKTFILVNRFIRLILDGNDPQRIICITYTKAAAAEMLERIIETVSELVLLSDTELKQKLDKQYNEDHDLKKLAKSKVRLANILDFPEQLKIQTIHSFCQSVLKSFPLEAGLPPFFNVIDDTTTQEIMADTWNRIISSGANETLTALLSRFQLYTVKTLFRELTEQREKIFDMIKEKGGLENYIAFLKGRLKIENTDITEMEERLKNDMADLLHQLATILAKSDKKTEAGILEDLNLYLRTKSLSDLESVLFTEKGLLRQYYLKTLTKSYPIQAAAAMDHADEIKNIINKKRNIELFNITRNVLLLFNDFYAQFEKLKKEKYLLDYDDLIAKTAELLDKRNTNSQWVLYKLDGGVDHILLDEAQDTNENQWKVIGAVTSEFFSGEGSGGHKRSLFVVGDEKQSIYSFQGADVNIFYQKKNYFELIKSENREFEIISLDTSFRSTQAVLDIVDNVLTNEKIRNAVTRENNVNQHKLSRLGNFGYFEINELCGNDIKSNYDDEQIEWHLPREYIVEDELKNKEIAANQVVARIDEILSRDHVLGSSGRRPSPADIMVLLRKRDELSELIIRKLQQKNIPVSGIDRLKLNENLAIKDLIALGKFILLENDDLNFASLLKSPIFEITEEQLLRVCHDRGERSVFEALKQSEFRTVYEKCERIRSELEGRSLFEFYFHALEVLDLRAGFISYFGTQINEILDEFLNIARDHENNHGHSLQTFTGWFEKSSMEIKRNLSSRQNEIRVLTVHGAKGLEAPIVIIPDTTSAGRNHTRFGIDGDMFLCPVSKDNKTELFANIEKTEKQKEEDEYYRLLYVALTRARDELYVFGYKTRGSQTETWHNIIWAAALKIARKTENRLVHTDDSYIRNKISEIKPEAARKPAELKFGKYRPAEAIEIISPSSLYADTGKGTASGNNTDFTRGLAVHKLLEVLPEIEKDRRERSAEMVLKNYPEMQEDKKKDIINEALSVLNNKELEFVFSDRSRAEVPVCGITDGKFISGKIDRLIEINNEVIIIDFKTNKVSGADITGISERYRPQLEAYRKLLEKIYSDKKIRTGLLFTSVNKILYL